LASLEEHERFFVKILYDKGKTACLNRGNFQLHIAATTAAAARFETPSMANYRGTEGQAQSSELFGTIVHGYLTMRLSLTKTSHQCSCESRNKEIIGSHLHPSRKHGIYCMLFHHQQIDAYIPTPNFAVYRI
jgi:hypothetical protein